MDKSYLDTIRSQKPYDRFVYYVVTRLMIHDARRAGQDPPWTIDPILATYKFTNVRRAWDYTSMWLNTNWYKPHWDHPCVGLATVIARFLCHVPTLDDVGFPTKVNFPKIMRRLQHRADSGKKVFTSAYMVVGGATRGRAKHEWLVNDVLRPAWKSGLLVRPWHDPIDCLHTALTKLNGFGHFMAQEVVLDLMDTHVLGGRPRAEKIAYGYAGPGAMRGLRRVNGSDARGKDAPRYSQDQARDFMLQLRNKLADDQRLSQKFRNSLTVHDIEFNLCEFDKYERTLWGQGTPKQYYDPAARTQTTLNL